MHDSHGDGPSEQVVCAVSYLTGTRKATVFEINSDCMHSSRGPRDHVNIRILQTMVS